MDDKPKPYGYETAAPDRYVILKDFAKKNRREMTESETILWNALRNSIQGFKFRRQHPIGDFIADFICLSQKTVIEVDGGYHNADEQQREDQFRTDYLQKMGFRIIRFTNEEVNTDLKKVILTIKEELNK
ncbi:MAG: endonuclease domain-containing protein [Prevotella sp.]|nr:endonuclease domain-containing protein [Prevotella sp.]